MKSKPEFRSKTRALDDGVEFARGYCSNFVFPPHVHEGLTLGLVTSGREEYQDRNARLQADTGAVYVTAPDTIHGGRSCDGGAWSYYSLYVTPEALSRILYPNDWTQIRFAAPVRHKTAASRKLARHITLLGEAETCLEREERLIATLGALYEADGCAFGSGDAARACDDGQVARVRDYIDAYYERDISLAQLAEIAGWSAQHLASMFKKRTGSAPYAYLLARRLAAARARLLNGEALSAIALESGFCDQSHLNRHFVRAYGLSPAAYRRAL